MENLNFKISKSSNRAFVFYFKSRPRYLVAYPTLAFCREHFSLSGCFLDSCPYPFLTCNNCCYETNTVFV